MNRHGVHRGVIAGQLFELSTAADIPQPQRSIGTGGDREGLIRIEHHSMDGTHMAVELELLLLRGNIPDPDCLVGTAGDDGLPIAGDGHTVDGSTVVELPCGRDSGIGPLLDLSGAERGPDGTVVDRELQLRDQSFDRELLMRRQLNHRLDVEERRAKQMHRLPRGRDRQLERIGTPLEGGDGGGCHVIGFESLHRFIRSVDVPDQNLSRVGAGGNPLSIGANGDGGRLKLAALRTALEGPADGAITHLGHDDQAIIPAADRLGSALVHCHVTHRSLVNRPRADDRGLHRLQQLVLSGREQCHAIGQVTRRHDRTDMVRKRFKQLARRHLPHTDDPIGSRRGCSHSISGQRDRPQRMRMRDGTQQLAIAERPEMQLLVLTNRGDELPVGGEGQFQ